MKLGWLKRIKTIWLFYLSLPLFLVAILSFRYSSRTTMAILALISVIYVLLAYLHHFQHRNLKLEIIIEYVLIAFLALVIFQNFIS